MRSQIKHVLGSVAAIFVIVFTAVIITNMGAQVTQFPLKGGNNVFQTIVGAINQITCTGAGCTGAGTATIAIANPFLSPPLTTSSFNSEIWVDGTTYTTISAAVTALPSAGGSVHLPDHYRETITNSTKVTLGSTTKPVILFGGVDGIITCNVTDGTYCIGEPNGSGIKANGTVYSFTGVSGGLAIVEAATAVVNSVVQNTTTSGQGFVLNQGYQLYGDGCAGATTSIAALNLDGVYGQMIFRDVYVSNFCNTTQIRLASNASATAGPYTADNVWSSCNGNVGCKPLQILAVTSNMVGIKILGGGYGQPGTGQTVINVDGSGGNDGINGLTIDGPDVENNANGSTKIIALKNVNNAVVTGVNTIFQNTDTFLDINQSGGGLTQAVSLNGLSASCPSTGGTLINNHITGYTQGTNGGACLGFINSYFYPGSDSPGLYVDGVSKIGPASALPATPVPTPGTSVTLAAPRGYAICTSTCTVSVPVPVAGYEFCVVNDDNVATAITLSALGSSAMYENTARTGYGTAGTGTFTATAAAGNKVCIVGRDATHYLTLSYIGTWTAN